MKDEIKEILDKLQKVANRETASRNALMKMENKDYQLLLDYITNLQQYYNDNVNRYEELIEKYVNLQEENERLKEENKHIFANVNDDELLISNAMNYAEAQDYKSRVEKAIEYIKSINERAFKDDYGTCFSTYDLLSILQGVDKDE